jgi:enoyl-CoA hydratase
MEPTVHLEMRGPVAVVTLARPPANALNHALFRDLLAVLRQLREPAVRAAVLTGQGRFFSAGLDLFEVFAYDAEQGAAFARAFDDAVSGLFALDKPLVAAINGHAVAGGSVLAATADFRLLAAGEGKMGITEIQVGVPFPASAREAIRYSCAGPHLHELFFRGLTYPPAESVARRLADEVCAASEVLPRALALAEELGSRPPHSFATTKAALRAESLQRMQAARAHGNDPVWMLWRTPETLAAMTAYRERLGRKS